LVTRNNQNALPNKTLPADMAAQMHGNWHHAASAAAIDSGASPRHRELPPRRNSQRAHDR